MQDIFNLKAYDRYDFCPEYADGSCYLVDKKGQKCLDFIAGIGVASLGYNNKIIQDAIKHESARGFYSQSNLFYNENSEKLSEELIKISEKISGLSKVFLCNSGVEAAEAAIKFARKYYNSKHNTEYCEIICIKNGFHGRSLSTIFSCERPNLVQGFGPKVEGFRQVEINNIDDLMSKINKNTCAIMFEPIQGNNGIIPCTKKFLRVMREICYEHDILMIADEIQTGAGRTGKFFNIEYSTVKPDMILTAKGIGGGIPIGACIMSQKVANAIPSGVHGSTFGGNSFCTGIALKVCQVINNEIFLENVQTNGIYFKGRLMEIAARYPNVIKEVRGVGLMLGLEFYSRVSNITVSKYLVMNGLLTSTSANNTIRMLPPLIIEQKHIDEACDIIENVIPQIDILEI